jgi:pyruvyltransferase
MLDRSMIHLAQGRFQFAEDIEIVYRRSPLRSKGIPRSPIILVWGAGQPNFGDMLSPIIVTVLSGRSVRGKDGYNDPSRERLITLGSSLWKAYARDIIWGTGSKHSSLRCPELDVRAVRGPLTRRMLLENGVDCPEVYGDPAILMPYLFKPNVKKMGRVGIIQHFNDMTELGKLQESQDIDVINVRDHPLRVIEKICGCEVILSSSLHGIILAEAYGVPACWLYPSPERWRNNVPQVEFKYIDYYLSTSREPVAYRYSMVLNLEAAVDCALDKEKPVFKSKQLLLAFPFLQHGINDLADLARYEIQDVRLIKYSTAMHISRWMAYKFRDVIRLYRFLSRYRDEQDN